MFSLGHVDSDYQFCRNRHDNNAMHGVEAITAKLLSERPHGESSASSKTQDAF
ncbi:MAG: hypothetical protein ACI9UN_005456 [Granulosicoccus sp.]|jgi:hypothetical protein